jgi:hypothetical protein
LSITHHTRKQPSTGPRTTHGPQSPPWWVHWQHTHIVIKEKRKRNDQKKLQRAIESRRKAKIKITWRRQVSDALGKGNGSTHPRQNHAQAKSTNHQSTQELSLHICKLPLNKCQPWAQTGQAGSQNRSDRLPKPVRPVAKTGQTTLVQRTTPPKSKKCKRNAQAPPWLLG